MKRIAVRTRSFGAEVGKPAVDELAPWIAERRGIGGDLTAYQIERSFGLQQGVDIPCAGGRFYARRVLGCLEGIEGTAVTGEVGVRAEEAVADVRMLARRQKGLWFALPAPSLFRFTDAYYGDDDEMTEEVVDAFGRLMREMRDAGAGGHVLIAEEAGEIELEELAGKKACFFPLKRDLGHLQALLEHQTTLITDPAGIDEAGRLADEYEVRELAVLHPAHEDLMAAAGHFDPDEIAAAGYTEEGEEERWKALRDEAYILR
ncbi:hypothetical protein [Methanofollis sp. UBA420]|jgi:hypothetical protein|uniref:hypothetical protein n=1 Tax=Methanofollis sp. UBA420 TaxID=1915514 RepID=UPI00316ADD92